MRRYTAAICVSLLIMLRISAGAADPLPAFTLREHLHRDWPAQLVHFAVEGLPVGAVQPDATVVLDEAGAPRACQWSALRTHADGSVRAGDVWFLTDLPADATRVYRLAAGAPPAPAVAAAVRQADGVIELDGTTTAVRLPDLAPLGQPAALAALPAPLLAVRLPGGAWAGKGWLVGDQPIANAATTITARGPLFAEATVTYEAVNGKAYTVTVRVDAGSPVALVTEQFNLPAAQDATNSLEQRDPSDGGKVPLICFSLSQGLNPDTARYRGYASTPERGTIQKPDSDRREGSYRLATTERRRHWSLLGWMSWWPDAGAYYTVYRDGDGADGPVLGFMRMFTGRWSNPTGIQVWGDPHDGLYLCAPLGITHRRHWQVDGVHDPELATDIYSGFLDADVAADAGKRCWALYAAPKGRAIPADNVMMKAGPNRAMIAYGEFPLDKVKDWTLDWRREAVARPRLHTPPARAAEFQSNATPAQIDAQITAMRNVVNTLLDGNGALGRQSHFFPFTISARTCVLPVDALLSSPHCTTEQRDELTKLLAFQALVLTDRDFFPVGTGFHLGNPNMPLALDSALALIGCALPDHPAAARWATRGIMKISGAFDKYVHPESGAWNECPHYMYDASLYQMFEAMFALRHGGYGDLFDRPSVKRLLDYCIGIMPPPDPRFGFRIIPTQGNTSLEGATILGWAAAAYANTDPALSARLQWMWQEDGKLFVYKGSREIIRPELPAAPPESRSTWYKGFGAILRNGFPDPNETYMAYRQGSWMSHYEDGDQGSWHLYAKGAPLSLDFGSQYGPMMSRPWLHNRISVDHKLDPMLQHEHDIYTFTSLRAADFVAGKAVIDTLFPMSETPYHPMELLPNTPASQPETIPAMTWRRAVLFVKDADLLGPNYFLVRDDFSGATKPTDWSAWCLATDVAFDGNIARFTGQHGVDLDVVALTPATASWVQNREAIPPPPTVAKLSYGPGVPGWPKEYQQPEQEHPPIMSHNFMYLGEAWKKVNGNKVFEERQICARLTQPVGAGYLALLYPRKRGGEPIPTYAGWANGQGAKVTLPAETHYLLLASQTVQVNDGDIALDAAVAVVRRGAARQSLTLIKGRSARVGKYSVAAEGPVSLTITAGAVSGETAGDAQTVTVRLPFDGTITLDGVVIGRTAKRTATINIPAGEHTFAIR